MSKLKQKKEGGGSYLFHLDGQLNLGRLWPDWLLHLAGKSQMTSIFFLGYRKFIKGIKIEINIPNFSYPVYSYAMLVASTLLLFNCNYALQKNLEFYKLLQFQVWIRHNLFSFFPSWTWLQFVMDSRTGHVVRDAFHTYRISAYSFRGNYSFLKVENVEIFI